MGKKAVLLLVLVAFLMAFAVSSVSKSAGANGTVKVIVYSKGSSQPEFAPFSAMGMQKASVSTAASVEQLRAVSGSTLNVKRSLSALNGFIAEVSQADYAALKSNPNFEVYPDGVIYTALDASVNVINASLAWSLIHNGTNITGDGESVCVIDTGVNYSHADMGGCTTSQFLEGSCDKVPAGADFYYNDPDPMDNQSHGTHVAGIIASTNSIYGGVAPDARIVAIRACNDQSPASCSVADIISGMDWCINNASIYNISVISMSLGGGAYTSWCDDDGTAGVFARPVNNATVRNITVVASTGNDASKTSIAYPACIRNVTAVGGTTKADGFYSNGNRNNITDLIAPGQSIVSLNYQGGTRTATGTSMSTPHVSGAMALLRQYFRVSQNVTVNATLLLGALNSTGKILNDSGGSNLNFVRIDPYAAIRAFDSAAPNLTFFAPTPADNSNSSRNASVFINVTSTETLFNAFLEWSNGTVKNYSLSGSGVGWSINFSTPVVVNSSFRVFGNDSAGNFAATGVVNIGFVNNSIPNITSFYPSGIIVSIAEPDNQTFNVSYSDGDGDPVNVTWMQNGSIVSHNAVNFTFVSGYSSANWSRNATYNITVNITDGNSTVILNWTLNVNDTNRAPQWNVTPTNYTLAEDANLSFNITGFDFDDAVSYHINNTANFTINSTSGNISLIVLDNFFGIIWLAVSVSDGFVNTTEAIFVNVTPVNDTPTLAALSNVTVNVTDWVNFTLSASDGDGDELNFSVNFSRMNATFINRTAANFSWKTNMSDSGIYRLRFNVTDGNSSNTKLVNVSVYGGADFDGDGVPDIYDDDDDNDGIPDASDSILGNATTISTTTLTAVSAMINQSSNFSRLLDVPVAVNVSNGSRALVEFVWNFTVAAFSLNFTIETENSSALAGSLLVRGLALPSNLTKNVTVSNINSSFDSVCIHDAEIDSVSNVSASCNGGSETLVLCPGTSGAYSCSLAENNTLYLVTGLSFSAVVEQCRDADGDGFGTGCSGGSDCNDNDASRAGDCSTPASSSSGGGGGGGGGGGAVKKKVNATNASLSETPVLVKNETAGGKNATLPNLLELPANVSSAQLSEEEGNTAADSGKSVAVASVLFALAAAALLLYVKRHRI